MKQDRHIKLMSEVEHCLKRPNMYIGSVKTGNEERYIFNKKTNSFEIRKIKYVPGLVKIFEEILDNSVDAFVDNNFKGSSIINIIIEDLFFKVEDNGVGIPNTKIYDHDGNERYSCEVAWGSMRAGSNFDDAKRISAGANGVGSFLTNIFSTKFVGVNNNSGKGVICEWENNSEKFSVKETSIKTSGVEVLVYPDFNRFSVHKFGDGEKDAILTRINMLAMTYPEIKFIFNNEIIKTKDIGF
jgi:DNA gyrase/topoisomerase IV subunit B